MRPTEHRPTEHRIVELDSLRGLAALAVVLYHFTTRYGQLFGHTSPLAFEAPWGEYGVDFFFILSGLMILRSLDRAPSPIHFAVGRFARLYPAYWAAAAMTFAAVSYFGLSGQEVGGRDALLNITMLQQLVGARHIDGAYWSLQVELLFYGGIGLLFWAGALRSAKRLHMFVACWLMAAAIYHWAPDYMGLSPTDYRLVNKASLLLSLHYAHLFALGILLYQAEKSAGFTWRAWLLAGGCCLIQALVDCWLAGLFAATAALAIRAIARRQRTSCLQWRVLRRLGMISYPLYLVHQNIGYILIRELERRAASPSLAICIALGVCILMALALTLAVERPGQIWVKCKFTALSERFPALARVAGSPTPAL